MLSHIPLSRGGPTSLVIFDIHALQERFYFGDEVRLAEGKGRAGGFVTAEMLALGMLPFVFAEPPWCLRHRHYFSDGCAGPLLPLKIPLQLEPQLHL